MTLILLLISFKTNNLSFTVKSIMVYKLLFANYRIELPNSKWWMPSQKILSDVNLDYSSPLDCSR